MAFQFTCPQGHLLEGDESLANQQLTCPQCHMLFIVPAPLAIEPEPAPVPAGPPIPDVTRGGGNAFAPAGESRQPTLLHIPCPAGHVLETPPDMLGLEVMCPHCGLQFTLNESDSLERKRKKALEQEAADRKVGNAWFNWAVVIAILVLVGLVLLIALTGSGG